MELNEAASRFDFHCCSFFIFFYSNGILTESVDNRSAALVVEGEDRKNGE